MIRQAARERLLPRMPEGRVPQVVAERDSLGEILVQPQRARHGSGDLRNLKAVGQPHAEMVAIGRHEHLRLVPQPSKADRMDDAVAITLERVARAALSAIGFGVQAFALVLLRRAWAMVRTEDLDCMRSTEVLEEKHG